MDRETYLSGSGLLDIVWNRRQLGSCGTDNVALVSDWQSMAAMGVKRLYGLYPGSHTQLHYTECASAAGLVSCLQETALSVLA